MPIPDYQSLMLPYLKVLSDRAQHSTRELIKHLSDEFQLSEQDRNELLPSGNQKVIDNRVGWARTYLKKAGLIESPKRGVHVITDRGETVLSQNLPKINVQYLNQFEEFQSFRRLGKESSSVTTEVSLEAEQSEQTPTEQIEQAHKILNAELASDILDNIQGLSAQFFEKLVVDLMLAMGYGGWSAESGKATQYTADGGIDGIINEDPLGLETIYLQAKRYKESNTVGRPDIQAFSGALDMQRARKGVFITTSKFSKDALEYVSLIEKKIVLIDGQKLAECMIKHGLGVTTKQTYHVKQLDSDFFSED